MAPKKKQCPMCIAPDNSKMIICTGKCKTWHHFSCLGMTRKEAEAVAVNWSCNACLEDSVSEGATSESATQSDKTVMEVADVHDSPRDNTVVSINDGGIAAAATHPAIELITNAAKSLRRLVTGQEADAKPAIDKVVAKFEKVSVGTKSIQSDQSLSSSSIRRLEAERQLLNRERELLDAKWELLKKEQDLFERTSQRGSIAAGSLRSGRHSMDHLNPKAETFTPRLKQVISEGLSQMETVQPKKPVQPTQFQQWMRPTVVKELPAFSGEPQDWPLFIRVFESSTERYEIDQEDNLYRLQRSLKGKAREVVQALLVLPENVPDIIEQLQMRFGRPDLIIRMLREDIKAAANVKDNRLDTLIDLASKVRNLTATLNNARMINHLNNPTLVEELEDKLTPTLRLKWAEHLGEEESSLVLFDDWLQHLARCASRVLRTSEQPTAGENTKPDALKSNAAKTGGKTKEQARVHKLDVKIVCPACMEDCITVDKCKTFAKMTNDEKWTVIKNAGLCKQCLTKHSMKPPYVCKVAVKCDREHCKGKHHPMMHSDEYENAREEKEEEVTTYSHRVKGEKAQFRYLPVFLRNGDKGAMVYAFCDEGSNGTFMEEAIAKELGLTGPKSDLHVQFTGESFATETGSMLVQVEASGTFTNAKTVSLTGVRTVKGLNLQKQTLDFEELAGDYPYLKGLPVESYKSITPTLLIGLNNWDAALPRKSRNGLKGQPLAIKCDLGWSVFAQSTSTKSQSVHHCCSFEVENEDSKIASQDMHEAMVMFLSIDSLGVQPPLNDVASLEERRAMNILKTTTTLKGDRYSTGLLWKHDDVSLPESKTMAMNRLNCLRARMARDPIFAEAMHQQIEGFLEKGYAREVSEVEQRMTWRREWYLPLFAAFNPNKPGKVRVVADAAAKVNGVSLNSVLLKGPDIGASLFGILLRFRERRIAFTGDTKEMFQQVLMNEEDQHSQRFLWTKRGDTKPSVFVFCVLTFGATCSPASAKFVRDLNAQRYSAEYPKAASLIQTCTYTDDELVSVDDDDEAIRIIDETKFINKQAGFSIHGWKSNSVAVMHHVGNDTDSKTSLADMNIDSSGVEKVLGMWWQYATSDDFTFLLRFNKGHEEVMSGRRAPTRREMMSILMSVYDPLGLIAHFLAYLKVLLQEVCRYGLQWDDQITGAMQEKWKTWLEVLQTVENLKIPRCVLGSFPNWNRTTVQLHILTDASQECCAAVAYLRIQRDDQIHVALVGAKTKVARLRLTSIPRLELNAAVMGARLGKSIQAELSIPIDEVVHWTDSKTVLCWLRSDAGRIQGQYVAFRVCEIQESTAVSSWRHVPSKLNIADDATKWPRLRLESTDRWFLGPPFLKLADDEWPIDMTIGADTDEEMRRIHLQKAEPSLRLQEPIVEYTRFSKWTRMIRGVAFVRRGVKWMTKKEVVKGSLTGEEFSEAERCVIRALQHEVYPVEVKLLYSTNNEGNVCRSSPLYAFSPYLDEDGMLRVQGRIDAAECVSTLTRRPIILPRQHWATMLLVRRCHEKYYHMNHETVIDEIRREFHISRLRQLLKSVRRRCNGCAFLDAKAQLPRMAPIPRARLMPYTRPFTFTGVDCCGPFEVLVGRHHEKRWIVLFTRAVHLEVVHGMDHDNFILVFRNFVQRRGTPKQMFSDNGTNFVKGERVMREEMRRVTDLLSEEYATKGMKWNFNPPEAPHMGGVWERLVRSVKRNLYAVQLNRTPPDPLFASYVIEVENILNSRPLTYLPVDSEESHALTPNDFLRGASGDTPPLGVFEDNAKLLKGMWRSAQLYANRFWRRWVAEYLPELTLRSKWYEPCAPIQPGDLVLIIDPKSQRNEWPRGRVTEVRVSPDGQVRSAVVQTATNQLVRPVVKLAVLKIQPDEVDLLSKQTQQATKGEDVGDPISTVNNLNDDRVGEKRTIHLSS